MAKKIEFNFGDASVKLGCNKQFKYKNDKDKKLHDALQNIFDAVANLDKKGNKIDSSEEKDLLLMMKEIFSADGDEKISEEELAWASGFEAGGDVVDFVTKKYNEVKGIKPSEEEKSEKVVQDKADEKPEVKNNVESEEEKQARLEAEKKVQLEAQKAAKAAKNEAFAKGINKLKDGVSTDGVTSGDYTVVRGDSLWKIAKKSLIAEGVERPTDKQIIDRLALIAKLNNIENVSSYKLLPNNTLKVPTTNPSGAADGAQEADSAEESQGTGSAEGAEAAQQTADETPAAEAAEGTEATEETPRPSNPSEPSKPSEAGYPHPESGRYAPRDAAVTKEIPRRFLGFLWKTGGKKVRTYDSEGRIISETKYRRNGSKEQETHYDTAGIQTHVVKCNKNNEVESVIAYDKDGKKIGKSYPSDWNNDGVADIFVVMSKNDAGEETVRCYRKDDGSMSHINEYNSKGKRVKGTSFNNDGSLIYYVEHNPETGKRIKFTDYSGDSVSVSDYNADEKETKRTYYKPDGTVSSVRDYNADGKETKRTDYHSDGTVSSVRDYNADGKETKRTDYYSDGACEVCDNNTDELMIKFTDYNSDGTVSEYYTYDRNADGIKIKRTGYDPDGMVSNYRTYDYNANGKMIKMTDYNSDGTVRGYDAWDDFGRQTRYDHSDEQPPYYTIYEYDTDGSSNEPVSTKKYNPDGTPFVEPEET